ncbi:MAG: diadenylate cyclase [Methanolobus sp.]|nr:diadenylate cyclase [Methanolobus sp.]
MKEFAQLDGVFVISEEGMVEAAGRYLDVDAREIDVEKGLGGRHVSAAAITRDTVAIAVTVSQSGGVIHIYMDGKELMYIESTERAVRIH